MEMEEYCDVFSDLKSILLPDEIYNSQPLIYDAMDIVLHPPQPQAVAYNDIINKQLMMNSTDCWNSNCTAQDIIMTTNPSSSSANYNSPSQLILPLENLNPFLQENSNNYNPIFENYDANPFASQVIKFSSSVKDIDAANPISRKKNCRAVRTPSKALEHVVAEKKRREILGRLYISLSKLVPGLKKLDKASILEDAINYTKALQERVTVLEKELANKSTTNESKSNNETTKESFASEIKARISKRSVLIKIFCKKHMGFMSTIHLEMEKLHLSAVDIRVMPFGSTALDITILAEMDSEFCSTGKDIVDHLEKAHLNPSVITY